MSHNRTKRADDIQRISEGITLPEVHYYPTSEGGRIIYLLEDGSTRQMIISDKTEAAILLKRHNLIDTYVVHRDGDVKMFKLRDLNCDSSNNIWANSTVVYWHQFEFTREQIIRFAAVNELETTEKEYGTSKTFGAVIPMFRKIIKAA